MKKIRTTKGFVTDKNFSKNINNIINHKIKIRSAEIKKEGGKKVMMFDHTNLMKLQLIKPIDKLIEGLTQNRLETIYTRMVLYHLIIKFKIRCGYNKNTSTRKNDYRKLTNIYYNYLRLLAMSPDNKKFLDMQIKARQYIHKMFDKQTNEHLKHTL